MLAVSSLVIVAVALGTASAVPVPTKVKYSDYFTAKNQDTKHISASIDCLLNKGPCDKNLEELKNYLPEIVTSGCASCSPENQMVYELAVLALDSLFKEELQALQEKYIRKNQMLHYDIHYDGGAQKQESDSSSVVMPIISFVPLQ